MGEPPQNLRPFGGPRGSDVPVVGPGLADPMLGPLGHVASPSPLERTSGMMFGLGPMLCMMLAHFSLMYECGEDRELTCCLFHHFGLCFHMFSCIIHLHANIHQHLWNLLV